MFNLLFTTVNKDTTNFLKFKFLERNFLIEQFFRRDNTKNMLSMVHNISVIFLKADLWSKPNTR